MLSCCYKGTIKKNNLKKAKKTAFMAVLTFLAMIAAFIASFYFGYNVIKNIDTWMCKYSTTY